jgi:hypothetical protein
MTTWAHRYIEPLLWLAGAAVVLALSGVPRCALAADGEVDLQYLVSHGDGTIHRRAGTFLSPDAGVSGMVARADHVHPLTPGCMPCPEPSLPWWLQWFALTIAVADLGGLVLLAVSVWQRRRQ